MITNIFSVSSQSSSTTNERTNHPASQPTNVTHHRHHSGPLWKTLAHYCVFVFLFFFVLQLICHYKSSDHRNHGIKAHSQTYENLWNKTTNLAFTYPGMYTNASIDGSTMMAPFTRTTQSSSYLYLIWVLILSL